MTRERDRYGRASWGEQLREAFLGFWRNRTARIVAAILLTGGLILRLLTPDVLSIAQLAPGDCLYLRPSAPTDLVAVPQIPGTPAELELYDAAERASCDLSHSHEVSEVFALGSAADAYPGLISLLGAIDASCETAFETYIGRARIGSRFATAAWVPNANAWRDGARIGACLVFREDRGLLDRRAGGSGG